MSSQLTLKDVAYVVANEFWNKWHNKAKQPSELERHVWQLSTQYEIGHLGSIEEIADRIFHNVNARITNKLAEEQRYQERIENIKRELLRKARTDKNIQTLNKIANLKIIKDTPPGLPPLTPEQIAELYDYYKESRDVLGVPDVRPKLQRDKYIKTRINEFVQIHPDEMLSLEEFKRIIRDWNRNITIKEAYEYYQNKFFTLPGVTIPIVEPRNVEVLGFKDKDKYKFGTRSYEINPEIKQTITNHFPLKDNLKKYSLHKVAPRGSYMIDFMIHKKKYVYLVAININTRYAMIEMTNITVPDEKDSQESQEKVLSKDAKTTSSYLRALNKMIDEVKFMNPIRHLTGDGESAFKSSFAMKFYEQYNITFHPVPRMMIEGKRTKAGNQGTDPLHTSLALVDRFIRTIRDMIFNAELQITPLAIKEMVRQYNNAPHSTLSKYIGFDVSPLMVQQDKNKEEYIVMKLNKENIQTRMRYDFDIPIGSIVKVYNEKDVLGKRRVIARKGEVVGRQGVLYKVKTNLGVETMPRYKLESIHDFLKYAP